MKVYVAGATGAVGRRLVPLLLTAGHEVVAQTRSAERAAALAAAGATPVIADALDGDAVVRAVVRAAPDAIIHELTALSGMGANPRRFDRDFAVTNRLRTEGTDILLAAAREAGAERLLAQSYTGWPYAREGGPVKGEDAPLDPHPARSMRHSLEAIRHLEGAVCGAGHLTGIVLRYGGFYGPGTSLAEDGEHARLVRARRSPVIGDGGAVWSFIHVADAATATLAALERGRRGIYNIVDDDPAPVREWMPALAEALGAPPPRRVPLWLGRLAGGEAAVVLMTQARGASNAKARRELGWAPRWASWREGFRQGLTGEPAAPAATKAGGAAAASSR